MAGKEPILPLFSRIFIDTMPFLIKLHSLFISFTPEMPQLLRATTSFPFVRLLSNLVIAQINVHGIDKPHEQHCLD